MKNHNTKRVIHLEEYVSLNGVDQYLFHSSTKHENPVMLFLHGGPGTPASIFAHAFQDKWEDIFTIVHWDQRGTGKTLKRNPNKHPTVNLLLQDLFEIVQYLKKKYSKTKIVLFGHSWGTVLGSMFVKQYPEEVDYYIGVGQIVNKLENERRSYEKVKELILQANDQKSLKQLNAIGDYPGNKLDNEWVRKSLIIRKLQNKYHLAVRNNSAAFKIIFTSPIFKLSDISAMIKGIKANKDLTRFLADFDMNSDLPTYKVAMYYVVGENDWQTPYANVQAYFDQIVAPRKNLFVIPNAGHMTMIDQPELIFHTLSKIRDIQSQH